MYKGKVMGNKRRKTIDKTDKDQQDIKRRAIARIKATQFKPKWQHTPTEAVRIPKELVPFLKAIAQELDEKLFLIDPNHLPEETIDVLLDRLSSAKLERLQTKIEKLIPKKQEQEAETERRENYKIIIYEKSELRDGEDEISVFSPYDPTGEHQRICKSITGYRFDGYDKTWNFPTSSIVEVLEAFPESDYYWKDERLKDLLTTEKLRREEEEKQQRREEEARQQRENLQRMLFENAIEYIEPKIDEPLANGWQLRNYQKEGVHWLIHRHQGGIYPGGILADDMGLGKTIEALSAAKLLRSHHQCHIFVICPVSLIENWQREAERVGVAIEIFSNHYRKIPQPVSSEYIAIADEAHYFQNPKSARTKRIKELILNENCIASWLLSVLGETIVTIRNDNLPEKPIIVTTIAKAVELMGLEGSGTKLFDKNTNFSIRSFSQEKNRIEWSRIYGIQAHISPEPLVTIKALGKTEIKVTKGHSLYVFRNGKIIQPLAEDIRPGDYLIRDCHIPISEPKHYIILPEYIEKYEDKFQDYVIYGDFKTEIVTQLETGKINYDTAYNWKNNGKYGCYMTYANWVSVGKPSTHTFLAARTASAGRNAKTVIPVSNIAWLVGYFIGDGWVNKNRLSLAVANKDVEYVEQKLQNCLNDYFDWGCDIREYRGSINMRISCKPLKDLFLYWFGGQKAKTKRIPPECFQWSDEARKLLVEGLIDSDGHKKTHISKISTALFTTNVFYTSISRMLLEDIKVFLLTLGIESAIDSRKMGKDSRPEFANAQQSYSLRFCTHRIEPSYAERITAKNNFNVENAQLLIVQEVIFEEPSKELVYDFAVEETENFIAGGVVCHNTGTPIKNGSPINLFPLLEMCQHKLAEDKSNYIDRYCAPVRRSYGKQSFWDITGAAHLDELSEETKDVILRRTKKECLKELPDKMRLYKAIELESKEKKAYQKKFKELLADYRRRVKEGKVDGAAEALVTLNYMRKLNSEFKVPAAIELVEELLEQGQQVVIFTEFVESAKALYKEFEKISELLIGDTKDRQGPVDRFQSAESKIFIGTIKAGGVGITLTAASNVILVDRPWTPGDTEQAEDRCYRLGQQNAVFVTWIQLGVVDESIDELIHQKQKNIDLVLAGKNQDLDRAKTAKELAVELIEKL